MISPSRRQLFGAALSLAAIGSPAWPALAAASGPPLGRPQPFSFERLKAAVAASARQPYIPVPTTPALRAVDYETLALLDYEADKTLWGDAGDKAIRFFPLGRYARRPVKIHVIEAGQAREVLYSQDLFNIHDRALARRLAGSPGFAGFRAMNANGQGDWLAFQGASYFRCADPFNQYGLSARGVAINTVIGRPESFPDFTAFWLERDQAGELIIYAALQGEHVAGAYKIACHRTSAGLAQMIDSALFFRAPVERLGVAPLTSMFWYDENPAAAGRDWRPQVHDSDGLAIATSAGERIWRPLIDPPRVVVNSFADAGPRGFGLAQRDRAFDHYQDDGLFYDRRPSAWVEPIGDWGPGSVDLVEIPTRDENNDNIVAFWSPSAPVKAGDALSFRYRLSWLDEEPASGLARVVATRIGQAARSGPPSLERQTRLAIDFDGANLAGLTRNSGVEPVVSVQRGHIDGAAAAPIAGTDRWRLMIDLTVLDADSTDVRAFLRRGGAAVSEIWSYQIFNA